MKRDLLKRNRFSHFVDPFVIENNLPSSALMNHKKIGQQSLLSHGKATQLNIPICLFNLQIYVCWQVTF